ncbi:MAG: tRNA uridine-5-carboxymethylaminomethyl(34) synthesis GTPase MnmE [Hyphomicrobiales bacterium]
MAETVAALSSGLVPSGVAVIRVSGPQVRFAIEKIAGTCPFPRQASLRSLSDPQTGQGIDKGLVLFFPGPNSFTGEDVAEFHCHGGRAVVDAMLRALWSLDGVRAADAGDFTRQAFLNGIFDLTQVEAVGDLIHASTSLQLDQALAQLDGAATRKLSAWRDALADVRAQIEADLDFADEDDVPGSVVDSLPEQLRGLKDAMEAELSSTVAERVRGGFRVVLAGAPNSGKSTLLNALLERDAALVSPIAGTTRDQIDVPIDLDGLPVVLTDTAGLRDSTLSEDPIERMGMDRARFALEQADCVVWLVGGDEPPAASLGDPQLPPQKMIRVRSKLDIADRIDARDDVDLDVSGKTGEGLSALKSAMATLLRESYGLSGRASSVGDGIALDARRRTALRSSLGHVDDALVLLEHGSSSLDHAAEALRLAQRALGEITGDVDAEQLLDRVFSRFCIGK